MPTAMHMSFCLLEKNSHSSMSIMAMRIPNDRLYTVLVMYASVYKKDRKRQKRKGIITSTNDMQ